MFQGADSGSWNPSDLREPAANNRDPRAGEKQNCRSRSSGWRLQEDWEVGGCKDPQVRNH